ncbi:hypothetical protein ACFFJB_14435 [Camelimonas abortus]|uniref:Lipoprotein n=1 Tax=Camelimonas abortus TaxID=1017184 RepID=A0ABV7LIF5_9HYPH
MRAQFRTVMLAVLAAVTAASLAACNARVRPQGVLPREAVPPPPEERNLGIRPKQGELAEPPVYQQPQSRSGGLSVPAR